MNGINREADRQSRRGRRRSVGAGLAAMTLALLLATPAAAVAAQPNHRACLGEDIRVYATGGSTFGGSVAHMAVTTDGVGAEIQAHLAGAIPDEIQPNSCND
jgi:hypothetical protein